LQGSNTWQHQLSAHPQNKKKGITNVFTTHFHLGKCADLKIYQTTSKGPKEVSKFCQRHDKETCSQQQNK